MGRLRVPAFPWSPVRNFTQLPDRMGRSLAIAAFGAFGARRARQPLRHLFSWPYRVLKQHEAGSHKRPSERREAVSL